MMGALQSLALPIQQPSEPSWPPDMEMFSSVPPRHGVAVLQGAVVVYEEESLYREEIVEGCFYVREGQRPAACLEWERWLQLECEDRSRRCQPISPLKTSREVVQALRWPHGNHWSVRLASGHIDGPYHDWSFGRDFVGKVVGLYAPEQSRQ